MGEEHIKIVTDFNKSFVENMVEEPYKSGMMNTVRKKFPLKSLSNLRRNRCNWGYILELNKKNSW